jgi:hypothetical protein
MLSEEEKAHIRLEEVFREELREELKTAKAETWRKRALAFFNSALGIWLLSSVALGLVTWTYTRWTETLAKARENREAVEKLDIEIAARIQRFESFVVDGSRNVTYFIALISLDNPSAIDKVSPVVFPEFHRRGLRSLLWELYTRVPVSERPGVAAALKVADRLSLRSAAVIHYIDSPRGGEDAPVDPKEIEETKSLIASSLWQPRWHRIK